MGFASRAGLAYYLQAQRFTFAHSTKIDRGELAVILKAWEGASAVIFYMLKFA